jgi:hypothetical protein
MLGVLNNRRLINNNNIMNYCRTSTEKSIRELVERKTPKYNNYLKEMNLSDSTSSQTVSMHKNSFAFLTILSISSVIYIFLHRKK